VATWAAPSGVSNANGATWQAIDSTSFLTNEASSSLVTTTFTSSGSFTPTSSTVVDGLAIKVAQRVLTPSGTFTVQLAVSGTAVTGTMMTCNISDLPFMQVTVIGNGTWVFFKFPSAVTLAASTAYTVQVQSSVANQVYLSTTTGTNYCRYLRTTTTGSRAAGDVSIISGDVMAAATTSISTLTQNTNDTNVYGSLEVGAYGSWTWGTSASTTYNHSTNSNVTIGGLGTLNMIATNATTIHTMKFSGSGAASCLLSMLNASIIRITGATKTAYAYLGADVAAAGTSITTTASTGWLAGDDIAIAPTSNVNTQSDRVTLATAASGTTVTVPALTYAHGGTAPVTGEILNLTRNIQFLGTSTTNTFAVRLVSQDFQIQYAQFQYFGSATSLSRGFGIACLVALNTSFVNYCAFKDSYATAYMIDNSYAYPYDNFQMTGCVFYGPATYHMAVWPTSLSANCTFTNCFSMAATSIGFYLADSFSVYNGLTVSGSGGQGISITNSVPRYTPNTYTNFTYHSNANIMNVSSMYGPSGAKVTLMSNLTAWRNPSGGVLFTNCRDLIINSGTFFGNANGQVTINAGCGNTIFDNFNIQAGVTVVGTIGIYFYSQVSSGVFVDNLTVGTVTQHSVADLETGGSLVSGIVFRNLVQGSTTLISGTNTLPPGSFVAIQKLNNVYGSNRVYQYQGILSQDNVIYDASVYPTATSSQRMTPSLATFKTQGGSFIVPVGTGSTFTVSLKVRTSSTTAGDSATYNGNLPQLVMRAAPTVSTAFNLDSVVATAVSSPGVWQTLTYTLPTASLDNTAIEFLVTCDGTTGWLNWASVKLS
jgi:hypothetical protein